MAASDLSAESEITILPDGRVYAFGITRQMADLLAQLELRDYALAEPNRPEAQGNRRHTFGSAGLLEEEN